MIKLNEKILLVMNCVYDYKMLQHHKSQLSGTQIDLYAMTFEFYKSLDLPEGMKKNIHDFEAVMKFDPQKEPFATWNHMEPDKLSEIIFKY